MQENIGVHSILVQHERRGIMTKGVNKSEFAHFQILRTCFSKVLKKLVKQQDGEISTLNSKIGNLSFEVVFLFLANFSRLSAAKVSPEARMDQ